MNEYRVPTAQVEAVVTCSNGQSLTGVVFMPVLSAVHAGRMRPAEWINGRLQFFPFRLGPDGPSLLLNKSQVVALRVVPSADAGDRSDPDASEVPVRRVSVEAGGCTFHGELLIDMPVSQQRVVDYLNREERFLTLHTPEGETLVNKELIARVTESEGA